MCIRDRQQVTHTRYGTGIITETKLNSEPSPREILLLISFPKDGEKTFKGEALSETRFFSEMQLPPSVPGLEQTRERLEQEQQEQKHQQQLREQRKNHQKEIKKQQEEERESTKEFAELKKKYRVRRYTSNSPSDPLYPILLRIDERELLDEEEVSRLESNSLYAALAVNKENEYRRSRDTWSLIKAIT